LSWQVLQFILGRWADRRELVGRLFSREGQVKIFKFPSHAVWRHVGGSLAKCRDTSVHQFTDQTVHEL